MQDNDKILSEHTRKIGFLESATKALDERLDSLGNQITVLRGEFREGITELASEFRQARMQDESARRQDEATRRPQYGVLVALLGLVLTAAVSFSALTSSPIRENINNNRESIASSHNEFIRQVDAVRELQLERLRDLPDDYERFGRLQSDIVSLTSVTQDLEKDQEQIEDGQSALLDRISKLEGVQGMMRDQLNAVDKGGSRKWVGGDDHTHAPPNQ